MKIVVFGAGALGAYFGARWEQIGEDVTFLVRPKRAEQLNKHGLLIHSLKGDYAIKHPQVVTNPDDLDTVDLVLLAVKGYHLDETLDSLKTLVAKGAKILPLLNGIEHISTLQQTLGKEAVLGGLSRIIATLDEKGDVVHTSPLQEIIMGALHPNQESICQEIISFSQNANMNIINSGDITREMWRKYMFITAFSGITTATNLQIGPIREQTTTFGIAKKMLKDMQTLANKHDVNLSDDDVNKAIEILINLGQEDTSSMHQDRRKGNMLEVEHLHGGAIRLAEKVGITLPYVETIYGLIKPFEKAE